ncbi:MAG: PD-(D/E)XK nuclease family protein [Propionicimonas sp.]
MSTAEAGQARWYSPTRLWSLLNCPASAGQAPVDTAWTASIDPETNAGTLAHNALEIWMKSGSFRSSDPRAAFAEVVDSLLPGDAGKPPPRWPITRARLIARASLLVELIGSRTADQILSEVELRDQALRLRGRPDLVLLGEKAILLDLKTQTLKRGEPPEWVDFQLNLYAHLVNVNHGVRLDSAKVFSLNRGLIPVPISQSTIRAALCAARAASESSLDDARPAPDVCRFCTRRLGCQPHWDIAPSWSPTDCVEGTVDRVEVAANGLAAIRIAQKQSSTWVSGIPAALVTVVTRGDHIRLVRVWQDATALGSESPAWRWGGSSAVQTHVSN